MSSVGRFLPGLLLLWLGLPLRGQEPPATNQAVRLEFSVVPTNNAILITGTTNVISVTVSNFLAFTNILITGREGTNTIAFNDTGRPPDNAGEDGVFRGNLVAPIITEETTIQLRLVLIGTDLSSITNEPPAEEPVLTTNRLDLTYRIVPRPPNDAFTNGFKIASAGGVTVGTNRYASLEGREPKHAAVAGVDSSVWWTWGAPGAGPVLVDLAGTDFAAVLAVYSGDRVSNLVAVASSTNDLSNRLPPNVRFEAVRGTTYRIAVSGLNSNAMGQVRLRVAPGGTPDTRAPVVAIQSPAPDSIVSDEFVVVTGSAREPFPLDSGVSNVVVQVNNGPLTNAIGGDSWSAVVPLPPGTNVIRAYAVDYAGNKSTADSVVVRYLNPTNDYFELSTQLEGTGGLVTARNDQASKEPGEPLHAGNDGGRSIWYWWRAPSDGQLLLTTAGWTLETLLAVYVGNELANLTEVISNDDAFEGSRYSEVTLGVASNEVYRIAVDAYGAAVGSFGLQYVFTPRQAGSFLNLNIARAAGGSVSPPGGAFPEGARVTLTAIPQDDFAFVSWEGDVVSTENPLTLVMTRNLRVTPRFRTARFTEDFETGDFSRIPWALENPRWVLQTNSVGAGMFAARSPKIQGRQSTSLVLSTNTGAGTASFEFRVSTEPAWDVFEFLIDGAVAKRWSGEQPWQTYSFNLGAGRHTLTWRYTKDPNFEGGDDAVFVDNVYLPPPSGGSGGSQRPVLAIHLFSEGAQLNLQGEAGVTYDIEASPSVAGPWTVIATQTSTSGIINLLDLEAVGDSRRFYRARVRP
ncbi:MAG: hypothetical protein JNK85_00615 [Verrucomicrobiales bacterium]|nr:hypothetical protein [Verrucomicrobiales bacterium]